MEPIDAKFVVLGAGAMGAATAYHLARRGEPVTLIEQFALGHDRGSSHGAARITRHSYADPAYARLMPAALEAWRALESDAGTPLYIRTGGVSMSPEGVDYASRVAASLREMGVAHRRMTGAEWNRCSPAFSVPATHDVVYEPDAGMLAAARAVAVQIELARTHGGVRTHVMAETPVRRIDLEGSRPVVICDRLSLAAERLIVTAGAWLAHLLPQLPVPLRVTRQQVLYFQPADPAPYRVGTLPVFIYKGKSEEDAFYGMPEFQGLGVKVARHYGPETDPDAFDPTVGEPYRDVVRGFLRTHLPGLADAAIDLTETCLYTVAPGEEFLLDFFPGRTDVIVASPCSGHGFKFSCLIGQILAELAMSGERTIVGEAWKIPVLA